MTERARPGAARAGARSPGGSSGWHVAAAAAVLSVATAPGQTAAVSVLIDPMIDELGLSRSAVSTAYLVGTLAGAAAMPAVGRALDAHGPRRTAVVVGAVFGAMLIWLSLVTGVVGLTAGFVGIRMAGQGALGLIATTATALWFTRRRGLAIGLVAATGSAGISLAPVLLERVITVIGWRATWAAEGVLVWAVVLPVAWFGLRDRPRDLGQHPDGHLPAHADADADADRSASEPGHTLAEAARTPFFWTMLVALATSGMLCTAVAFHQIALLGGRGLSTTEAAANFLPQTVAGLVATLIVGTLVDHVSPRWLTGSVMALLAAGLLWATVVTPGWSALGFGVTIGAAGGAIRSVEAVSMPRYYGTAHLGSIRGVVTAVSVGSTAFGPLAFALVQAETGSFTRALVAGAVVATGVGLIALAVRPPARTRTAS